MNKCEALLLEHVDAVLNLLNDLMLRDTPSQLVLQRLNYLYVKINDLCIRKLHVNHEPTDSGLCQQAGRNLAVTKNREFQTPTPSMGRSMEDVEYVCGLCRSPITIFNTDHKLSLDLHYQDDIHQKALKVQKMRQVQAVIPKPGKPTKQLQKMKGAQAVIPKPGRPTVQLQEMRGAIGRSTEQLKNMKGAQVAIPKTGKHTEVNCEYISHTAEKKYHCCLCNMNMAGQKSVHQHVTGTTHQKKLAALQTDDSKDAHGIVNTDIGVLCHQVYSVPVGCSNSAVQHKWGKADLQNLSKQSVPSKEGKFWSKIPEDWRSHRKYFVNLGATTVQCDACNVNVPKTVINVLSHIRGKKHCHVSSENM
jgi:hypothetical protein